MNNKGQGAVGIVFLLILFGVALYACFVIVKGWADNLAESSQEADQQRQEIAARATGEFLNIQNTRVALEVTVTWLAIEKLKSQATATQAIVDEQMKKAPVVVQTDTDTGITKRWMVVVGALIVLMIVGGTGFYLVQLTETKASVAHRGPEGITVRRGNTFLPVGRTSGATTITPASWVLRARHAVLELVGKEAEPVTETVTDHSGITPDERVRLASQALATNAIVGAAEAKRVQIEKGAVGTGAHLALTIHEAPALPPAPAREQAALDVTVNQLEMGGPQSEQVAALLAQLGYRMPLLSARGQVVDQPRDE